MATTQQPQTQFIDPVCSMTVQHGGKTLTSVYRMRTYHFCATSCRTAFEANPEKYTCAGSPKRKGIWGRYLDRLNKVTGGRAQNCH